MALLAGRRAIAATAAAALLGLLGGCGSDDEPDANAKPTDPGASTGANRSTSADESTRADGSAGTNGSKSAGGNGQCEWAGVDDVSDAVGEPMVLDTGGPAGCIFKAEAGDGPQIWISVLEVSIDPTEYAEGTKKTCDGSITDVDAGDIAWTCENFGPQGFVFKGKSTATLDAKNFPSDDAAFAALKKLLPQIQL